MPHFSDNDADVLAYLYKNRHTHDGEDFQSQITVIRTTFEDDQVSSGGVGSGAHIHLKRSATQTIAVGGEAIAWDTQGNRAPYEWTESDPAADITIPKNGYYNIAVFAEWDTFEGGGSVKITRSRNGITADVWPEGDEWTATDGQEFEGVAHAIQCEPDDTINVVIDHDDASSQDLAFATVAVYLVDRAQATPEGYRELVLSDGPIAYWRLGEGNLSSPALDETGNGHDGTYSGGVVLETDGAIYGDPDTAATFSESTNDGVDVTIAEILKRRDDDYTIEAWTRLTAALSQRRAVFCWSRSGVGGMRWGIGVETSGSNAKFIGVRDGTDVVASGFDFAFDIYHHVVMTYNASTDAAALYVNGVEIDTGSQSTTLADSTEPVRIGRNDAEGVDGDIDEVAIYGRVLDASEILEHYVIGSQGG